MVLSDATLHALGYLGASGYTFDVTLGDEFAVLVHPAIDPLDLQPDDYHKQRLPDFMVQPGRFLLGHTVEIIEVPSDCVGIIVGKSTLARCGVMLNTTLLQPGWRGQLTLEIHNLSPVFVKLTAGMEIGQVLLLRGESPCLNPYQGKYQDQRGVTLPR